MPRWSWTVKGEIDVANVTKPLSFFASGEVDQVDDLLRGFLHLQRRAMYRHGATVEFPLLQQILIHSSPDVTKRLIAMTNRTKTIANCCQWRWDLIHLYFFLTISQSNVFLSIYFSIQG